MSSAQRLLAAFEGSKAAYGETTVGRIGRKGKAEAKSYIRQGLMTEAMVQAHIDGKQGVGAIPITQESMCRFGALDVDVYDLDHKALQKKIQTLKLPLIHCRTKSGGAHLYLFFRDWQPASLAREYLIEMSIALGFSGCEIFPKQDALLVERGDLGNFINMPYFSADQTTRYAFDRNAEALELEEFLDLVESSRVDIADLDALDSGGLERALHRRPAVPADTGGDGMRVRNAQQHTTADGGVRQDEVPRLMGEDGRGLQSKVHGAATGIQRGADYRQAAEQKGLFLHV
jgi:hypothetical protein